MSLDPPRMEGLADHIFRPADFRSPGYFVRSHPGDGCLDQVNDLLGLAVARLGRGEDSFVASLIEAACGIVEMERRRLTGQ